ncbi:hypothetical protein BDZ89DRAFT_1082783 [Hymenopellis radicata]|nr:hypothetical protein BDZ89DRAFT_1082783 [Hymenopellis radicata]
MMIMHGFEPMGSVPISPAFFEPFPERRAAYVDWDSPSVIEDIYGKPKDAPVVRAAKAVVRLGRPKKFEIKYISPLPHRLLWYRIQRRSSQRGATRWWRRTGTLLRRRRGGLCAGEHLRLLHKLILLSYAQRIPKHTHQPLGHRSSLHVQPRPSGNPRDG